MYVYIFFVRNYLCCKVVSPYPKVRALLRSLKDGDPFRVVLEFAFAVNKMTDLQVCVCVCIFSIYS